MSRYARIGSAPAQTVDALPDQTLFTQEDWREWNFTTTGGVPEVYRVDTGRLHTFSLPPTSTRHFIWIAAGAYFHGSASDFWFVQGALQFFRGNRPVGFVLFGDCDQQSAGVPAQTSGAMRKLTRIAPDGNGSVQPSIRYQRSIATVVRNNLDIACIEVPVLADRVDYICQASRIEFNSVLGNQVLILTGCRIMSVP